MTYRDTITADYVRAILKYNKRTGVFTWRRRPVEHFATEGAWKIWNAKYCGQAAGCLTSHNYWQIIIDYKRYYSHRLAWLYVTGSWPEQQVDHINGDRTDCRWANLREATPQQNNANARMQRRNETGFKGVSRCPNCKTFRAQIFWDGKFKHLGTFATPEEGHEAYIKAAKELWGPYARAK